MDITDAEGGLTTSSRQVDDLARRLEAWLTAKLGEGVRPRVTEVDSPASNGMSSETLLFTLTTDTEVRRCVARIEPEMDKLPVFPHYELLMQYRVMELVGSDTAAPVPPMLWFEPDAGVVGAPFLVMGAVDGHVPPDILPYTFGDCWVSDADPAQVDLLERSAVAALAEIHSITPADHDLSFLAHRAISRPVSGDTALPVTSTGGTSTANGSPPTSLHRCSTSASTGCVDPAPTTTKNGSRGATPVSATCCSPITR